MALPTEQEAMVISMCCKVAVEEGKGWMEISESIVIICSKKRGWGYRRREQIREVKRDGAEERTQKEKLVRAAGVKAEGMLGEFSLL